MAKVFLDVGETYTELNNATVYGNTGAEDLRISGAPDVTVASTVERIDMPGTLASYTFSITGNIVTINSGATTVATVTVPDTVSGQTLAFADGSAVLKITGLNQATLGTAAIPLVSAQVPATLNAADISATAPAVIAQALTIGVDTIVGGAGNDTVTARDVATINADGSPVYNTTFNQMDSLDGGAGTNTFNIISAAGDSTTAVDVNLSPFGASVTNFQTANVTSLNGVNGDVTGWTGLTSLNVLQSSGYDDITAAATTDVNVKDASGGVSVDGGKAVTVNATDSNVMLGSTVKAAGAVDVTTTGSSTVDVNGGTTVTTHSDGSVTISGETGAVNTTVTAMGSSTVFINDGTSITVNATGATTGTITVGGTAAPTGAVVINETGIIKGGTITVTGGSTVTVTETALRDTNPATTTTQAAVTVTGTAATTSVTVNQTAAAAAVPSITETAALTFAAAGLTAGQFVTVAGLTYTSTGVTTQAQLAAAFAGLADGATTGAATATGSYTGTLTGFRTGEASGTASNIITATSTPAATNVTDLAVAAPTAVVTVVETQGYTGLSALANGEVRITDVNALSQTAAGTITSVTLNNFGASTVNSAALASLNLAGTGTSLTETDGVLSPATATTLALNLNGVTTTDAVTLDADHTTLNIASAAAANTLADLNALGATTVGISGNQALTLTSQEFAANAAITSTSTAAVTLGGTLANGQSYTGGIGVDTITVDATIKAIATGDGNDKVTLNMVSLVGTGSIDGGAGTDTLAGTSSNLGAITADASTATKIAISNFEKLEVTDALASSINVAKFQASGLNTVKLDAGVTTGGIVTFGAGASTLELAAPAGTGATTGATIAVVAAGTGVADAVTITNTAAANATTGASIDTFAGNSIAATGVETLVLNGTGNGTATLQTVGAITVTGTGTATTAVDFIGANSFSTGAITTNTVDASGLTGTAGLTATVSGAALITGSANADTITFNGSAADATVNLGAGNDNFILNTHGTGKLFLNLGDGNDTFSVAANQAINSTDVIDGGAGIDTLQLQFVGSANVGAFKNFELFDVKGLDHNLDTLILSSNNAVTEIVASGAVSTNAALTNLGAGVNFHATADMGTLSALNTLSLTQATAGALTVTLDADSTSTLLPNSTNLNVNATNATALTAVFGVDSAFVQTTSTHNTQTINLTGAATSLAITSGGTNASNVLTYTDVVAANKLAGITVTGSQDLDLTHLTASTSLTSINAATFTGHLAVDIADLKAGAGTITLGLGADTVNVSAFSNATSWESIASFGKAAAAAFGTDPTAAAAAADQFVTGSGVAVAGDSTGTGFTISHGVMTFTGAGPANFDAALALADTATVAAVGTAVEFQYLNDSYVFVQASSTTAGVTNTDGLIKLVGTTGVTHLAEVGTTDHFIIG